MAGLIDGIDPQTALLLGLGQGLMGTVGNGRRASFAEALANGSQQGMAGYRQAMSDRQRAEQMRLEQVMREQQMEMARQEGARAEGRYGMDRQTFDAQTQERAAQRQREQQLRALPQQFATMSGQTLEEPGQAGFDRAGYGRALEQVDPMAGLQYQQMTRKERPAPVSVAAGASLVNPETGQAIFQAPKEQNPTDSAKKYQELKSLGYPDQVAQGIAYGMLEVVPDGNGGTAIVHKAQALSAMGGGTQPPAMPQQLNGQAPGGSAPAQRGAFDAPAPLPGQIGGTPGAANVKARLGAEESMRKEFTSLPSVKTYSQAFPAYQNVLSAASRNTPQSDINMVYGIAKLYDPDSVVREGEYATIANSQNIPERIKGYAQFVMGGGKLTPETKRQFVAEAESRHGVLRQGYDQSAGQYRELAGRAGVAPDTIITSFGAPARQQGSAGQQQAAPQGAARPAAPNLKTISRADFDATVRGAFALGKTRNDVMRELQSQGYAIPIGGLQ